MSGRWLRVGAVAAMLLVAVPAAADTTTRRDRDDSRGLLDVERLVHRHAGGGVLVHRLRTFERWDFSIFDQGSYVYMSFYVNGGRREDRTLTVSTSRDGTPYAEMRDAHDDVVGYARVWKPSGKSLQVEFPKDLLGKDVAGYRWKVTTRFHQPDHEDCGASGGVVVLCYDRAPRKGKVRHDLG